MGCIGSKEKTTPSDSYRRPKDLGPLNRNETQLADAKRAYNYICKQFDNTFKASESLCQLNQYPRTDSHCTPAGLLIQRSANDGTWTRLLTPAGYIKLVEGGSTKDQRDLTECIEKALDRDWEIEDVSKAVRTYHYFEKGDAVRGPFTVETDVCIQKEEPVKTYRIKRLDTIRFPTSGSPYFYSMVAARRQSLEEIHRRFLDHTNTHRALQQQS